MTTTRRTPWFLRMFGHVIIGCLAASMQFLYEHGYTRLTKETTLEWISHAFLVALFVAVVDAAHSYEQIVDKLRELERKLDDLRNDERIILARTEPLEQRREVAVIGVERLNTGQIPAPLEQPSLNEKWEITISLLRFDRFQDLLFSSEYLKHFLKLHDATKNQFRILIVNDQPRAGSEAAIRSFLQMSQTLGIQTFVFLKSEFYEMCDHLDHVLWRYRKRAQRVRHIMEGQPELSLMRPFPDSDPLEPITTNENYKLRFRDGHIFDVGPTATDEVKVGDVDGVYGLMHLAMHDHGRLGLDGLAAVLEKARTNHWSRSKIRAVIQK